MKKYDLSFIVSWAFAIFCLFNNYNYWDLAFFFLGLILLIKEMDGFKVDYAKESEGVSK